MRLADFLALFSSLSAGSAPRTRAGGPQSSGVTGCPVAGRPKQRAWPPSKALSRGRPQPGRTQGQRPSRALPSQSGPSTCRPEARAPYSRILYCCGRRHCCPAQGLAGEDCYPGGGKHLIPISVAVAPQLCILLLVAPRACRGRERLASEAFQPQATLAPTGSMFPVPAETPEGRSGSVAPSHSSSWVTR